MRPPAFGMPTTARWRPGRLMLLHVRLLLRMVRFHFLCLGSVTLFHLRLLRLARLTLLQLLMLLFLLLL